LRQKSLPISVRANPRRHAPPPLSNPIGRDGGRRRRRWLDAIATIVMVALVPALLLPYSNVEATLERPVIVGRTVGAHAGGVSILAPIAVRFDRPVTGVSNKSFVLRDSDGQVVPASVTYDTARNRAELLPLDALHANRRYEATVSSAIRSTGGVAINSQGWTLRTLRQPSDATRFIPARAVRFAPGRVIGIRVDPRGDTASTLPGGLADYSWAMADAKATIRNRSYFHITDGKWAGYFVAASSIVGTDGSGPGTEPSPAPTASPEPSSVPGTSPGPSPTPRATPPAATAAPTPTTQPPTAGSGILISTSELRALPMSGSAWSALKAAADASAGGPNLADMNQDNNVRILAKALVYARTGTPSYRAEVISALRSVMGTEAGGETLALGRELAAYVIAADLIGLRAADPALDATFRAWLAQLLDRRLSDGNSLTETHERRPNNWGTHAGASRAAAAAYLGDSAELARAATVFRGWLGERSAYAGFSFGELGWQSNPSQPVGINPPGAAIAGHSVDGVLPDDQRRTGDFTWPPPCGNYPYGALDGALLMAEILHRAGYGSYAWGSRAILRAEQWLASTGCPPSGDNLWQGPLVDARYGSNFWSGQVVPMGKNFAWTDWLYGR
jgi:Alginate lyase/Bacterial Ig-like domain